MVARRATACTQRHVLLIPTALWCFDQAGIDFYNNQDSKDCATAVKIYYDESYAFYGSILFWLNYGAPLCTPQFKNILVKPFSTFTILSRKICYSKLSST